MAAQDMPPPGGFSPIFTERTFPKPLMRQSIFFITLLALTANGIYYINEWRKRYRILRIEQAEHYIAMAPFLYSEQDRKFLKVLKRNRIDEEYIMKGVPGWTPGTFFGEPIYKTAPPNLLQTPFVNEFMMGRPRTEWTSKVVVPDWYK